MFVCWWWMDHLTWEEASQILLLPKFRFHQNRKLPISSWCSCKNTKKSIHITPTSNLERHLKIIWRVNNSPTLENQPSTNSCLKLLPLTYFQIQTPSWLSRIQGSVEFDLIWSKPESKHKNYFNPNIQIQKLVLFHFDQFVQS